MIEDLEFLSEGALLRGLHAREWTDVADTVPAARWALAAVGGR